MSDKYKKNLDLDKVEIEHLDDEIDISSHPSLKRQQSSVDKKVNSYEIKEIMTYEDEGGSSE